ncbi:MAG: DUF4331 domain-containing protein [Actinomycetota bacterium]|nr:DUF4331 domain-containing protein [Actinomycetota bacterium]
MARLVPPARRRGLAALLAGATAVSGAALLAPGTSTASSHREAPYISMDPSVDNTDTYAFVSPDDPNSVTFIANWWPFEEPAGGPNFYPWDPDAAYDINIDNDGDAKADIVYRWTFNNRDRRDDVQNGGLPGTILYNNGPVTSLDDENLLFRQTYDLTVMREGSSTGTVVLDDAPVAPSNVGVASMPDYTKLRREAVRTVASPAGQTQSYVGQADDPFFLDLRVFDLLYGGNLSERGYDTLKEYNVNTIAYKVPKAAVVARGDAARNPVIGVWSTTSRRQTKVFKDTGAAPAPSENDLSDAANHSGEFVQVSRLGNPLVNEAVVPAQLKDFFNRLEPTGDAALLSEVQNPELPTLIEAVYGIRNPNRNRGNTAAANRNDLVAAFLTGFSRDVFAGRTFGGAGRGVVNADLNSLDLNEVSPNPAPAEYLRLNVNVPPTPAARANRLGVVGGDLGGFPNGRRLQDDVVDIAIQVFEGALVGQDPAVLRTLSALDGVNGNDRPFLNTFPYIADPHAGSDPRTGREKVMFKQEFTSSNGMVMTQVKNITPAAPGGFVQLYRINPDGSSTGLGSMKLNGAGTASVRKVFPARRGERLTLNYRVFTDRRSAAESNRGVPTTFTVR